MAKQKDENLIVVGRDTSKIGMIPETDHPYYIQLYEADMASKRELDTDSVIKMNHGWDVTTCAYVYLRDAIRLIGQTFKQKDDPTVTLPIADVMTLGITYSQSDLSEKEGNINIMFYVGNVVEDIVKYVAEGKDLSKDSMIHYVTKKAPLMIPSDNDEDMYELLKTLDRATRKDMSSEYEMMIGHDWFMTTVATYYFKNLLVQLYLKFLHEDMKSQSLNFFDLIEININPKYEDEEDETNNTIIGRFSIGPGVSAKLGVKDDGFTDPGEDDLPF